MLKLYRPALDELWFRRELLLDADTMSYNQKWGGVISFPKEKWSGWYDRWVAGNELGRFYRYLTDTVGDKFIGEAAYHYDDARGIYLCDVIVHARYRGNGYGTEGLRLLCEAAKENGVAVLYDDIAVDNPALRLFLKNGFAVEYETDDAVTVKRAL